MQKRQNEKRNPKVELKQPTNSYKIYRGVEKNKCAVFKKSKQIFSNKVENSFDRDDRKYIS